MIYRKIIDKNFDTINTFLNFLKSKSNLKNIRVEDEIIYGEISNDRVNYQKYGGSYMST